jgi:hypothetical protein
MKEENSEICIVGKGSSLLQKSLGNKIDSCSTIIRVNHLPNSFNKKHLGARTCILSTRCEYKLADFLAQEKFKQNVSMVWICSEKTQRYDFLDCANFLFMNDSEIGLVSKMFPNFLNINLQRHDKQRGFFMPDTGIATILLCCARYPNRIINVCGFDLYKHGNNNLYEFKPNSSLFLTPVFQQTLIYNHLIKSNIIRELT